ncbi:hypothetical protein B0A52_07662 [Exophiala mesophila]|uniref:Uncharacterized protein n=1 Tax=Exophiala mesophila TaxID=212818 RepID=A0A438MYF7_EXOME|nr:hypothetical protein B0A52_07662 [Exophiala mesophila]
MVVCRRDHGSCSCTSTSFSRPLTETILLAAGPHLIRWSTLVFYGAFLRQLEPVGRSTTRGMVIKEYAQVRSHLRRVDVGKAWKEYITASKSRSVSSSSSHMDFEILKKRRQMRKWRAFVHKIGLRKRKVSCLDTETPRSEMGMTVIRPKTLVEMFESVANRLRVSQAMLEMAFLQYASHVETVLKCPELGHRPMEEGWMIAVTAQGLARNADYEALGRRILTDIEGLPPSKATQPCEETESKHHVSSLAMLQRAWRSAGGGNDDTLGDNRLDNSVNPAGQSIRTNILGEQLDLILRAIRACRSHYFDSFQYTEPQKVQCPCRPTQLEECDLCSSSTGSSSDSDKFRSTKFFKHRRQSQLYRDKGKEPVRKWGGGRVATGDAGDAGAAGAPSVRGSMVKYILHSRVYSEHFNPFVRRKGCFEFVHERAFEDWETLLHQET